MFPQATAPLGRVTWLSVNSLSYAVALQMSEWPQYSIMLHAWGAASIRLHRCSQRRNIVRLNIDVATRSVMSSVDFAAALQSVPYM